MASSDGLILSNKLAVLQAPIFDGLSFDPFPLFDDDLCPAEVGICGCHIVQALVIALMVVVFHERFDLPFEVTRQEVIFQEDAVFQGLVPAFDLALRLWMERRTAHMAQLLRFDIFRQFTCDITGTIVRQQPRLVLDRCMITA